MPVKRLFYANRWNSPDLQPDIPRISLNRYSFLKDRTGTGCMCGELKVSIAFWLVIIDSTGMIHLEPRLRLLLCAIPARMIN